jgi:hypothetical protein
VELAISSLITSLKDLSGSGFLHHLSYVTTVLLISGA